MAELVCLNALPATPLTGSTSGNRLLLADCAIQLRWRVILVQRRR